MSRRPSSNTPKAARPTAADCAPRDHAPGRATTSGAGVCQTEQFSRKVDLCCNGPECGTGCAARQAERRGIACRSQFEESSNQGEVELSNGQAEQVAVFFDFENLAIGARRDMPSLGQESVSAPALKLLCQQRGSATIRRAYADWGQPQFAPYQKALALDDIALPSTAGRRRTLSDPRWRRARREAGVRSRCSYCPLRTTPQTSGSDRTCRIADVRTCCGAQVHRDRTSARLPAARWSGRLCPRWGLPCIA